MRASRAWCEGLTKKCSKMVSWLRFAAEDLMKNLVSSGRRKKQPKDVRVEGAQGIIFSNQKVRWLYYKG
jgi:hypothetical protein